MLRHGCLCRSAARRYSTAGAQKIKILDLDWNNGGVGVAIELVEVVDWRKERKLNHLRPRLAKRDTHREASLPLEQPFGSGGSRRASDD